MAITGTITSPNYPSEYPPNSYCTYQITLENAANFQILFNYFRVENEFDFLYYGIGTDANTTAALGSLTGYDQPANFQIESSAVWFIFTSDGSVVFPGFNLTWIAEDPTVKGYYLY